MRRVSHQSVVVFPEPLPQACALAKAARTLASAPPAVVATERAHAAAEVQKVAKSKPAGQKISLNEVLKKRQADAEAAKAAERAAQP